MIGRPEPEFIHPLLQWYAENARDLPWRVRPSQAGEGGLDTGAGVKNHRAASYSTGDRQVSEGGLDTGAGVKNHRAASYSTGVRQAPDPYRVWVSEIMLQQTRVETVISYFERWMARFADIASLAAATQQEVLSAWEGLGYYSRARSLHRAAQMVMAEHAGQLPRDLASLRKLPGVGAYTAGAIASIAFGLDAPALDGNIRRVLSRIFNVEEQLRSPAAEKRLWELAARHLPPGRAGDYNQALMDLGARLCTPRAPACPACPVAKACQARALGLQEARPVKAPRPAIPHYTVTAAILERDGLYLIAQRPANGLLGGLWEFPGGKQQEGEDLPACLRREIREELEAEIQVGELQGVYQHAFTHFRITLHAFHCMLDSREPRPVQPADIRWVKPQEMPAYPMGKIDRQIAKELLLQRRIP